MRVEGTCCSVVILHLRDHDGSGAVGCSTPRPQRLGFLDLECVKVPLSAIQGRFSIIFLLELLAVGLMDFIRIWDSCAGFNFPG